MPPSSLECLEAFERSDRYIHPQYTPIMRLKELLSRITLNRKEDFPFPENLEEYLEDFIPNVLLKSETLQQAFGVSSYEMEEIYKEAYSSYQENNYLESSTSFRWLVLLNPFHSKY